MESLRLRRIRCAHPTGGVGRGFTFIELLVVLGIIGVITVMAVLNQNNFNKTITLVNTTYDVALTLRTAQERGLGNRTVTGALNVGYGIHFDITNPSSFVLFADTTGAAPCVSAYALDCNPGDKIYADTDTTVQTIDIGNGIKISKFCVKPATGTTKCTDGTGVNQIGVLDIVFVRPNADVSLYAAGGGAPASNAYTVACVALTSAASVTRYLSVNTSGQILAQAASCP